MTDALLVAAGAPALQAAKPMMPMVLIGFVLVVTFVFIAFDWLHKTIAALLGAIVAVALALALDVFGGEKPYLRVHDFVHHDLGVEAALKSKATILPLPKPERILLAVDQSNQGETAERFAAAVAQSHHARVMLLYAYEGVRDAGREEYLSRRAAALSGLGVELEPLEELVRPNMASVRSSRFLRLVKKSAAI